MPGITYTFTSGSVAADVEISNHGSLLLFHLLSDRATEWVDENVSDERIMFGCAIVVEHRYAFDLARGMIHDGLAVA